MEERKYDGLYVLKVICAFFVVCIHTNFKLEFRDYFLLITRTAVPIFFMISGFFYEDVIAREKDKRQIFKILFLCLWANFLYFIYDMYLYRKDLNKFFSIIFNKNRFRLFILLNNSPFSGHLWYLGAILSVLIIFFLLRKITSNWKHMAYFVAPFLFLANWTLGKYSILLFGREVVEKCYTRNFLLVGIPYFITGLFLKNHSAIVDFVKNKYLFNLFLIVLFYVLICLEHQVLTLLDADVTRDYYVSDTLLAIAIFIFFTNNGWNRDDKYKILKTIGKKYTTMIYIWHLIVADVVKYIVSYINNDIVNCIHKRIRPFLVFLITVLVVAIYYRVKEVILKRRSV